MVTLLRKLFIKDWQNVSDEKVRYQHGRLAALFGLVTNVILVAMKLTLALILASRAQWVLPMALLSDALNNLGDCATCLVTLVGFKMAQRPADKEHPFGHQRVEYIAGLIVAVLILVAGVELLINSSRSLVEFYQDGTSSTYDVTAMIILGVSILLKLMQSMVNRGLGKAISSKALQAVAIDSLMDVLATSGVLICALLTYFLNLGQADGICGILVSLFVCYSGFSAIRETSSPLIGEPRGDEYEEKIRSDVLSHPEILGIHDVICHAYGANQTYVSLHAEMDSSLSLEKAHEIVDGIEDELDDKYHLNATIHIDPVVIGNPEVDELKAKAEKALESISGDLSLHDFHYWKDKKTVSFDVLVPYDGERQEKIMTALQAAFPDYLLDVHFDHPMA